MKNPQRSLLMPTIGVVYSINRLARKLVKRRWQKHTVQQLHNRLIMQAAQDLGIEIEALSREFFLLRWNSRVVFCQGNDFSFESLIAFRLCGDKNITSSLLSEAGLPVPRFASFRADQFSDAVNFLVALNGPCVVKPTYGTSSGDGVSVNVNTKPQFRRAFINALSCCPDVLVEEYVEGQHFRITLLDGELIFAHERIPARVVGDGRHTLHELVKLRNGSIATHRGVHTAYPIEFDRETMSVLRESGLKRSSVPRVDEIVTLKKICNADMGGETRDRTSSIDDRWVGIARRAAMCLGARLVGVDLIISSDPSGTQEIYINEVNTTPGFFGYDPHTPDAPVRHMRRLLEKIFEMPEGPAPLAQASPSATMPDS